MIDELIADEALTVTDGDYPRLKAGPRAMELLSGDEPVHMTLGDPGSAALREKRVQQKLPVDKALFSRLASLRREIAEGQHVPPFIIFTNATLRDMTQKLPGTRQEMLRVAGVGASKYERYGRAFLDAIERYQMEREAEHARKKR